MPEELNPEKNKDVIVLVRQPDGNWKGWMNKHDKLIHARQMSPGMVLEYLLVHDGKVQ